MINMATIELRNITHVYQSGEAKTVAVKDINLTLEEGTANALIGPSGCGKTTLLNIISGLLTPTEGQILINGKDVTSLPPQDRDIAQVFQFPIVYDSMSVFENLAFPLKNKGRPKDEITKRVKEIAELLELEDRLDDNPGNFGPEWSQLVSLGRGLIRDDMTALLLDEPMTDVDPSRKLTLRRRITHAQRELGITALYVTHDQHEALTFANKAAVMNEGQIIQYGTPEELYNKPASTFVGNFIGSPGMNFIDCEIEDRKLRIGEFDLPISGKLKSALDSSWTNIQLGVRPYQVEIYEERENERSIPATVTLTEPLGSYQVITLEIKGTQVELKAKLPLDKQIAVGSEVFLEIDPHNIRLFRDGKAVELE